ncbi:thiamine diphosphokinase [Clostridium sp. Marseille-Q2269]|uniref:thiamine diphosphokinase n=1 Tax=Clostridium sp. Marseille-Q2269 TaxID=2942205 RepID=UPI0020743CC6|nr:thiamine diphosphokinase [Clostridium sp. Marseille-Q2269]
MKSIVIAGGKPPSKTLLQEEMKNASYIICADSGANCLYQYDITPDFILGDMDSIDKKVFSYFKDKGVNMDQYPKDKDFTDGLIALNKAIELKSDNISLLGCTGSRIDHVLGNLGFLQICLKNNIKAYIKDENNEIFLTDKSISLSPRKSNYFSLQAYGGNVEGVTLLNSKFPLQNYTLKMGDTLTTSNEFTDRELYIQIKNGTVIVIISKDNDG